ncbi:MAG TPA: thiazole synthase, partial [Bacteroidetes bacterium]|nr:thiazole synthase [Bacteroidota bacterium]
MQKTVSSNDSWSLAGKTFHSRLMIGTSMYPNPDLMFRAIEESGAEIVTVSIRRMDLRQQEHTFLSHDFMKKFQLLPNTSGCYTAREAVFTAELAREALGTNWIKVEVIGDEKTLLPDPVELLKACEELVAKDFVVLPYCTDDPVLCKRLADMGCVAVMPLAAPIGTGLGIRNPHNLQLIRDAVSLPLIVDAGIGTASDAAIALELGYDGILLNTAIAQAQDPILMARAMRLGVEAGRAAFRAG